MNQDCLFDNLTDSTPNPVLVGVAVYITRGKNHAASLDCVYLAPEDGHGAFRSLGTQASQDFPFPWGQA